MLDNSVKTLAKWIIQPSNVIDLIAILPFWIEQFAKSGSQNNVFVVLRILRLTRIFRVFKVGKYNEIFSLFGRVMKQSLPALYLMLFFVGLGLCLFGTLMWYAEQGEWYPPNSETLKGLGIEDRGAYLRNTHFVPGVEDLQESPFVSIIHSFWFVIVTVTTVGYGDAHANSPTTPLGKLFGAMTILCGVVVLAMPVGVIGANFSTEYDKSQEQAKRREKLRTQKAQRQELQAKHAAESEVAAAKDGSAPVMPEDLELVEDLRKV